MDILQYDDDFRELVKNSHADDVDAIAKICYGLNIRSFHDACISYARKGLAKQPGRADLYYELIIASSLDTEHVLGEIQNELESLVKQSSDQGARSNLALVYYFLERDEDAEEVLQPLLDDLSDHEVESRVFEVLAQLEYTRQNMEQCIYYCDKAIDRPGRTARVVRLKGLCCQELGDYDLAKKSFHFALELEPNFVWACHSLGSLYLEQEAYDQAFRYFGKATYINPQDPGNLFLVAEAFMDMEAFDLAAGELNKLLLCKPEKRIEAEVHNALGYIGIRNEDYDRAKHHLSLAMELEPELAVAYFNMGQVARSEGSLALAEHHFKKALEYDPLYVDAWVEMGFLRIDQGDGRAESCFLSALEVEPYEASAYLGLSRLKQSDESYSEQLEYALKAFELDPDHPEISNNLGIAYECNQELDKAEEAYRRALDLNPLNAQAANNLGYLYETLVKERPQRERTYRNLAISAWTQRLQICIHQKKSTKAAVTHLLELGLTQDKIDALAMESYQTEP